MADNTPWFQRGMWQAFKWMPYNTAAHSGLDLGMPCGTPVTAPSAGRVIHSSGEAWGGQVDILLPPGSLGPPYDPNKSYVMSFLHLSREDVSPGPVAAGQQIGLSGQPPPGGPYGSGCHVHFELTEGGQAPYIGYNPRYPTAMNHPVNPAPLLAALGNTSVNSQAASIPILSGVWQFLQNLGSAASGAAATTAVNAASSANCAPWDIGCIINAIKNGATGFIWRFVKFVLGVIMISGGLILFALPTKLQIAGAVTGQPELVQAGSRLRNPRRGRSGIFRTVATRQRSARVQSERQGQRAVAAQARAAKPAKPPKAPKPAKPAPAPKPAKPAKAAPAPAAAAAGGVP